jgi:hypothetical protein
MCRPAHFRKVQVGYGRSNGLNAMLVGLKHQLPTFLQLLLAAGGVAITA